MKALPALRFFAVCGLIAGSLDARASDGSAVVVERGLHHRVWQKETIRQLPNGRAVTNRSAVVELESGMHFQKDGQWKESTEEIELFQGGAVARNGPHQVIFAPNFNTAGVIDMQSPDGQRFRSHVLGLGVYDPATGRSELIAEVKDSIGELSPPNEIYYRNAFDGVLADMRYVYRKGGFEQDVIVRESVELPPGYDPATTRLEVWTEFIEAPAPRKIPHLRKQNQDETLDFGTMQIGRGKAFAVGEDRSSPRAIPINKKWVQLEGRNFLIEAVDFQAVGHQLRELPPRKQRAAMPGRKVGLPARAEGSRRPFPAARHAAVSRPADRIMLASLPFPDKGLVLDYEAVSSTNNFRFKADTTYYVSGAFTVSGLATFEGGAVIKYANTNSAKLTLSGTVAWEAAAYRPVILTARDDHTVGEQIGSATRSGYYASSALNITASTFDIRNVRVSYASTAFLVDAADGNIQNAQVVQCGTAIDATHPDLTIKNLLVFETGRAFKGVNSDIYAEQVTLHRVTNIWNQGTSSFLGMTNSVLAAATNGSTFTGFNNSTNLDDSGIFQTVGAASHYLASGSALRNAGTTNITPSLRTDLKKRTTHPPVVIGDGTLFTNNLTLYPQAQRDTDIPDLGYHYDPLDYVFSGVYLTNASITAKAGVAIGIRTPFNTGLGLLGGSAFYCEGTPESLNRFVRYNTVQEQSNTNWTEWANSAAYAIATAWSTTATAPILRLRFTEFSVPASSADNKFHLYGFGEDAGSHSIRDCQFHAGDIWSDRPTLNITNSLFNRTRMIIAESYDMNPSVRNCTFVGGNVQLYQGSSTAWTFKDNLFDATTLYMEGTLSHNYNGYTTNITRLTPNAANDRVLTVTNITYDSGWLGRFYLPTNMVTQTNLFDKGSAAASTLGLYHYTTVTNQTRELTSTVDMGFHYVAVNTFGLPLDGDGDGRPDYSEDLDGDGTADAGETNWQVYESSGNAGGGPGIVTFTPIK